MCPAAGASGRPRGRTAMFALAVVLVAGCGGSSAGKRDGKPNGAPPSVRVEHSSLGRILVDTRGKALYLFIDDRHGHTSCYSNCARTWPPATVSGNPIAGPGLTAKLTTTRRRDHAHQLVYNGHPLYTSIADTLPGQTNGQAYAGRWFVLSPAGHRIGDAKPARTY
jgi:predicted lipoprotein with Yx(FWY)xxD motif